MAAAVAVAAVAFMGIGATAALAAPADVATIDDTKPTSLTIHKYEGPANTATECAPTGQPVPASCLTGKTALDGVEFSIYKVMDLNTNQDWLDAKAYYEAGAWDTTGKTPVQVVTTAGGGLATASNLEAALYYVVETGTPAGYTPAVPFFVTLPMTDPTDAAWDYDIDVYPKNNKVDAPHKSVTDVVGLQVGDPIPYRISQNIQTYNDVVGAPVAGKYTKPDGVVDGWDISSYGIGDKFPVEVSNPTLNGVYILPGTVDATKADLSTYTPLVAGTDYNVLTATGADGRTTVYVDFLKAGLDKIAAAPGSQIVTDYTSTLASIPASGQVVNQGYTVPGVTPTMGSDVPTPPTTPPPPPEEPPGTPTNEVVSKFGQIRIEKVGENGTATPTPLGKVEFTVYPATVTGTTGAFEYTCPVASLTDATALTTFTTADGTGIGESPMLGLSTWYNDGVEIDPAGLNDGHLNGAQYATKYGERQYCLVETKAADGYQLLAEPVLFRLTQQGTAQFITDAAGTVDFMNIVNQPDNIKNELPLTGGQGVALISIGGLVLIGGGLGYYVVSNRRREEA